ncbi:MAG: shikimate kinase [Mycoplasmataceae bacterium]|jgi:shikimate kinase|nr:shikimate kinase [Mycoplasmataceae bacterium]
MNNIYLTGMMGCGKTTIGQLLKEKLGISLYDLDTEIIAKAKMSIDDIFKKYGEPHFRKLESQVLQKISQKNNSIVACGGGVILNESNVQVMKNTGIVVYIKRLPGDIVLDVVTKNRPLIKDDIQKIFTIYEARKQLYEQTANFTVKNKGKITSVVTKIVRIYNKSFQKLG